MIIFCAENFDCIYLINTKWNKGTQRDWWSSTVQSGITPMMSRRPVHILFFLADSVASALAARWPRVHLQLTHSNW